MKLVLKIAIPLKL